MKCRLNGHLVEEVFDEHGEPCILCQNYWVCLDFLELEELLDEDLEED